MSHFLDRLMFLTQHREPFAGGHGETRMEDRKWEEGYRRLVAYVERHGDARVPKSYTVDGYQLGAWAGTQRRSYAKGTLDTDRERRLQDLPGWTWKASSST